VSARTTRAFRRPVERLIAERFGIVNPVTDARRLLRAGQENTDEWLAARTATIGASEISILMMDDHPYHSRFSLWHVKAHGWGRFGQTSQQERGHLLEPGIARRFAQAHPELIVARPNGALWRDPVNPALSCTPDFITINRDAEIIPLECKSDEGGDWGSGEQDIPAHHWWQVQQQAGVFAAPYGYVARWAGNGYRDYIIEYDHERYGRAAAEAAAFLRSVADGIPPEPDGHRASIDVLSETMPVYAVAPVQLPAGWGDELSALKESRKHLDKQIKNVEARIRDGLSAAPTGYDVKGRTYARTRTPRKGYTVAPTVIDQVRTREPADEETP
jgi:predicted phage-related endonuclease